jgi:hypothetical protein
MVEHIGFDAQATNASDGSKWSNPPLKASPRLPKEWSEPIENPECVQLWQIACAPTPVKLDPVGWLKYPFKIVRKALSTVKSRVRALK